VKASENIEIFLGCPLHGMLQRFLLIMVFEMHRLYRPATICGTCFLSETL
jgi:hypothetical protein